MPKHGRPAHHGGYRLFVAADPPAAVAAELAGWARAQRRKGTGLRVTAPDHIHLTLAFLGARRAGEVEPITRAVGGGVAEWALADRAGPVALELGAPAWLPPRHPRALAVDVRDPSGRLGDLHDAVVAALATAIGWGGEGRRFRPHLTAARLSGRPGDPAPLEPTPSGEFHVDAVTLYRSFLQPSGARYEALERVPLS